MIKIVTFGTVKREYIDALIKGLEGIFEGNVDLLNPERELLGKGYNKKRGQYAAEIFIEELLSIAEGDEILLGITEYDIYTEKMNFVFGQAQLGGQATIISLRRLDPEYYGIPADERLFKERILKEAVHEIGHCLGLDHCNNSKCNMVFSNSILAVDCKNAELCNNCIKELGK